jgi:hypothetical protein
LPVSCLARSDGLTSYLFSLSKVFPSPEFHPYSEYRLVLDVDHSLIITPIRQPRFGHPLTRPERSKLGGSAETSAHPVPSTLEESDPICTRDDRNPSAYFKMSSKAAPTDRTPLISSRQTVEASYDGHRSSTRNDLVDDVIDTKQQEEEPQFNIPGITQRDFVLILTGLWSATFLGSLDGTIVATLLTDIGTSFEKSNMASWLGTSYLLSVCCFTPIYGRLCDIIGRRGAILTALTFFGIGTIGCGIAPSMETLILARAVAGAGGGAMMSVGSIIVTDLGKFPSGCRVFSVFLTFCLRSSTVSILSTLLGFNLLTMLCYVAAAVRYSRGMLTYASGLVRAWGVQSVSRDSRGWKSRTEP